MLFEPTPPSSSAAPSPEGGRRCPRCGAAVTPEDRFCTACGAALTSSFPVRLELDYPERLSRLSTLFRLFLAIPVLILLAIISGGGGFVTPGAGLTVGALGSLILAHWIAVLLRGRPVRWLFDVIVAIQRFALRAYSYFFLLTDRYPPFEGDWSVRYEVDYPERLSRWRLVIWKTVTVIPHVVVLGFVFIAVAVVVPIAWFAVLFTGRYPRGLHTFVSGWLRWGARAWAYWLSLTDEFPSFSFSEDAGRGSTSSYVISAIFGWLIVLVWVGAFGVLAALPGETEEAAISYEQLLAGESSAAVEVSDVEVMLLEAEDPYGFPDDLYVAEDGRFVLFRLGITNERGLELSVREGDFRLEDSEGDRHDPFLVTLGGLQPPRDLEAGDQGLIRVLFEVPADADPAELVYRPAFSFFGFKQKVKFVLE